jgi:hypothetical protein
MRKEKIITSYQEILWEAVFSKFASPEQSYRAALCQGTEHKQPQAPQTDGKSVRHPVQQHLPQQEIKKTGLSVQFE